jgi:hypothetical protein
MNPASGITLAVHYAYCYTGLLAFINVGYTANLFW